MLSTDGRWKLTPRLHSVKFVFDAPTPADSPTPDEIVFENPFSAGVPGVPKRFVFRSPTTRGPEQDDMHTVHDPPGHGKDSPDAGTPPGEALFAAAATKETTIDAESTARQLSHVRGPVVDLKGDIGPAVCAAWALVLSSSLSSSSQTDGGNVSFGLSVSNNTDLEALSPPLPIRFAVSRHTRASAFLRDVADSTAALSGVPGTEPGLKAPAAGKDASQTMVIALSVAAPDTRELSDVSDWAVRLECRIKEQELELSATFDHHFSRPAVRLLLNDVEHVIWQLDNLSGEKTTLGDIKMLSPASQRHLVQLNRPLPKEENVLIHDVIDHQVQSEPHAPAICAWDGNMSYSQLQQCTEQLAYHLSNMGVGPEVLVPVIFEKSLWSIVAILAVVRAGGAVVALDPSLPAARIRMIVQDVKASVVLSSPGNQHRIPEEILPGNRVIVDESFCRRLPARTAATRLPLTQKPSTTPDNALYVVYTSGSTGKPKGVVVPHAAFCSSVKGFCKAIRLDSPSARVLQYSSFSFDISMLEILSTLMVGACLCIPSEEERMNNLARSISSMGVNWAMLTPSVASLMSPEEVSGLEVLCFVGEALPQAVADTWADHVQAINAYGPAECSAITIVSEPRTKGVKSISLGRPANCAVWIVGEDGRLAPFNTVGEIVIEGPPVARGYLGDGEKTGAVFLDDPGFLRSVARDSGRCYRTGDLGRMKVDGSVDFLGRKDGQVKINGQRVELGEVEHHLARCLGSTNTPGSPKTTWDVTVELLRPIGADHGILTAFVTPTSKSSTGVTIDSRMEMLVSETDRTWQDTNSRFREASAELATILPAYMVPRAVIACHRLPLSPSGKVDRRSLRGIGNGMTTQKLLRSSARGETASEVETETSVILPSGDLTESEGDSSVGQFTISSGNTKPSSEASLSLSSPSDSEVTPIEAVLRKAWATVLGVPEDTISPEDDFFALGGDSIGAIKVVAACRRLALQINVASIFKNSVLRRMALVCKRAGEDDEEDKPARSARCTITPFQFLDPDAVPELREEASFQCDVRAEDIQDLYPCTHMQEGLMAVNLTRPGSYTGRWIHALPQDVELTRFKSVWEHIHATSPILRTRFATTASAGSLQAVIREGVEWLSHHDLEAYLDEDDSRPMYPGDPLNRFALVASGDGAVTFVWTIHHMLYDGWSLAMLCGRLNDLYHGRVAKPATDYRRFIAYTRELSPNASEYWKRELRGSPVSSFPAFPDPRHQSFARAVVRDELVIDIDPSFGVTMSTFVRAAWSLMVGHFSASDDVLFGATVSGRNAPLDDIESVEGPTIATVPVRVRIDKKLAIVDFLRRIQDQAASMIPFEQTGIQGIKALNDDTRRACKFQNLLVVQAGGGWEETGPGPLLKPAYREEYTTFPVTCEVWLHPGRVDFATHVDEEVTSRVFVAHAIETVKIIMTQLAQATSGTSCFSSKIADIVFDKVSSLSQSVCNRDQEPVKVSVTLHELITKQSRFEPERDAVVSTTDRLSYATLEAMASALGQRLVDIWTVVALLGVLKAGAVFVPLDPSQPISRLREVVAQVRARTVLMSAFQAKATDLGTLTRIIVDQESLERLVSSDDPEMLATRPEPDSPAYVIFTSGSTGTPKGIVVSHAAFASSATAHGSVFGISRDNRVLQFSAYSFDASLFELLTTLIHGGTVCVPMEAERLESIGGFMRRMNVDLALLTPSVARIVDPAEVPSLRTLILGGEAPDGVLVEKWRDAGTRLFNAYGPSECSVIAACHCYSAHTDPRTIGLPVGCSSWIVNADDNEASPVADGDIGELLLGGPTLADGYLNDPARTAAAFVDSSSWPLEIRPRDAGRLYKTGDLVRKDNDGNMVYVGRKDMQVKVNGQRIEIGDIESHLSGCLRFKRGVVVFPTKGPFSRQLVVVLEAENSRTSATGHPHAEESCNEEVDEIRRELSEKVPSIMVPAHWVGINTLSPKGFPLSASGKVDRKLITTWLEGLSGREPSIFGTTAQSSTELAVILPDDFPAYELAEKISSLIPSRSLSPRSAISGGFDDILLQASGLDSLNMMSLMHFIHTTYRTRVSMQFLMDEKTSIRSLAAFISRSSPRRNSVQASAPPATSQMIDIMAQVNRYDDELFRLSGSVPEASFSRPKNKDNGLNVFLTGASGYLGTQILRQLLERGDVGRVTALVRSSSPQTARSRVVETAQKALWWTEFHDDKLDVWAGDLSRPQLGLAQERWDLLGDGHSFDAVIHNGAAVHWNKSYSALEAVNVGSTVQLLGLAIRNPSPRFAYVSGGRQWRSEVERDEDVALELAGAMGYSQTKFVAEVLVKRAADRSRSLWRNIAVYRPGLVIGTATEGVANLDDYIWRLTSANIDIGAYNADDEDAWLHVSDAATTAAGAIRTALEPTPRGNAVESQEDGMTWGEFWRLVQASGYHIRPTPASEWLSAVRRDVAARQEAHPLWPLSHLLDDGSMEWDVRSKRVNECPMRLKVAVRRNLEFLMRIGFLPAVGSVTHSNKRPTNSFRRSGS
ncbi:Putative AMP-dependent synthetase/ligase domain, Condensation domain, AMP-binding, ANL [Colletotrichum destructivum]|uniref:AMP-dependent synthetase/ligase domain, Condensation domain, AMP-binding, ANL n=1 Tax=Colletotrichum destructivum TaxID=34406 RepID=A0AAX4IGS1_9PEZI|nr:Putative AMP-dependent synthetase/ligase domain, Condensation domain, AMP-binding, ANL [Colletotrichum destructivum]